ncbi:MAG: glycine cleavage system protein H [Elusimicrobia bacterium RIFCSPLOWO2_01_FULL_60_11]|nr:MAG: glycine cleavage system protein H [Elusimicrobia bacterium RIFCSPLOWO2_01_FULL_60_11]
MQDIEKLRFAKSHEWIAPDGTVGITDHAQKEVTDVVFVELPPLGKSAAQDGEVATLESVKAAFPINAPVAGKVSAVNDKVAKNPELINQAPYGDGWLFKLDVADAGSLKSLMTNAQYEEFLKTDAAHP